jgi:hypothetical protein
MESTVILRTLVNLAGAAIAGWVIFRTYRGMRQRSISLAGIFAAGILARTATGLLLYCVSYFELPFARSLQLGDGFWTLAEDGKTYYWFAATAASTVGPFDADYSAVLSPFYTMVLAVWLSVVGSSPMAGLFLNLCLYALIAFVMVRICQPTGEWRRDVPGLIGLGAYSLSPSLVIHATQPLKEDLFYAVVAIMYAGLLAVLRRATFRGVAPLGWMTSLGVLVALFVVTVLITEIRWYYSVIAWGALALVALLFAVVNRTTAFPHYAAINVILLTVVGSAAIVDTPSPEQGYLRSVLVQSLHARTIAIPSMLAHVTGFARLGFLRTGGATNIVIPLQGNTTPKHAAIRPAGPAELSPQARNMVRASTATPQTFMQRARLVATGIAIVFVPISILKQLSIVDMPGGSGLLPLTDVDTVFLDVTVGSVLVLLWRRRRLIGDRLPFVVFALVMALGTAVLMGYVVTNYGTLFRLRPMIAVPLWFAVLSVCGRGPARFGAVEVSPTPCAAARVTLPRR